MARRARLRTAPLTLAGAVNPTALMVTTWHFTTPADGQSDGHEDARRSRTLMNCPDGVGSNGGEDGVITTSAG